MKKYWFVCLPAKLNSWWVTKSMQEKNPNCFLFSFDRSHKLRKFRAWLPLLWFWNVSNNAWNGSRVFPSALCKKNVLVSAAAADVLHWQRLVLKDRSLNNVLLYSTFVFELNCSFKKKVLLILQRTKSCKLSFLSYWHKLGFSIKK